jgi:MYXO-CTERM domain-containing protein
MGADGVTFTIQTVSASLGSAGGGLGIGGVSPSVAIEFDTYENDAASFPRIADPSSFHIGVDLNGNMKSAATAMLDQPLDDGRTRYVWVDYDGFVLTVRLNDAPARPNTPQLAHPLDLSAALSGATAAFVGFTRGTGASYQRQEILSWEYTVPFVEGGVAPDGVVSDPGGCGCRTSGAAASVPLGWLVTLGVASAWRRRARASRAALECHREGQPPSAYKCAGQEDCGTNLDEPASGVSRLRHEYPKRHSMTHTKTLRSRTVFLFWPWFGLTALGCGLPFGLPSPEEPGVPKVCDPSSMNSALCGVKCGESSPSDLVAVMGPPTDTVTANGLTVMIDYICSGDSNGFEYFFLFTDNKLSSVSSVALNQGSVSTPLPSCLEACTNP